MSADRDGCSRYAFQQDVEQYVWYDFSSVNKKKEMYVSWEIHKIFLYVYTQLLTVVNFGKRNLEY